MELHCEGVAKRKTVCASMSKEHTPCFPPSKAVDKRNQHTSVSRHWIGLDYPSHSCHKKHTTLILTDEQVSDIGAPFARHS
jgi:hypothetical protein